MNIRLGLCILILTSIHCSAADDGMKLTFQRLKTSLKPLVLNSNEFPEQTEAYLQFYSLDFDAVKHSIGAIQSGSNTLAVQVFQPLETIGTVILSHGYYDHAGVLKHLIRRLIESRYTVAVIDHAGHGLSTGTPAAIGDFKEYVDGLNQLIDMCDQQLPDPLHLIGHSMGCAVCLDSLLKGKELAVDQIILLAPLIRSKGWKASGWGLKLLGDKLESVPRKFRRNSSDEAFLAFHKQDPLQAKTVPMSWVSAHRKWYEEIQTSAATTEKKVTIIQGTKDSTVDWEHNLKFLKQRITNADVIMIKGGGHQLMNEAPKIRNRVWQEIVEKLQSQDSLNR